MSPDPEEPVVSVVMATYNRSNIIGFSIESLLRGTFSRWELIVVGDGCTDDTEAVVRAFADPRIRFVNLPQNFGEQSGPNNLGASLARGRYIAFLNHDDLWFSDHLERSVAMLESTPAVDLIFGIGLAFYGEPTPCLVGATARDGRYRPALSVPASLWVFRKGLMDRLGPWAAADTIRQAPSQDWLHRCHRAGAGMMGSRHLAAAIIASGSRKDAYRLRQSEDHARLMARFREPGFAAETLLNVADRWENPRATLRVSPFLAEAVRIGARKLLDMLGVFPPAPRHWLRYWRKGSLLRALRRDRGLPQRPQR